MLLLGGWWASLDNTGMLWIKAALATATTLLLGWGLWLRRKGRPRHGQRLRDRLLLAFGLLGAACWWNLGHFHFEPFEHIWEIYHYYLGAKYQPELGYTRLYDCTAVADAQEGLRARVEHRKIRNLETNAIERTDRILSDPESCTGHFTVDRWVDFKADVAWFRNHTNRDRWDQSQLDHGFNGSPVWTIAGRAFASLGPATDSQIRTLASLDVILLLCMWGFVVWAFGWRIACVALVYWGTNYPARYWWNGGAFLRMDWLAVMVIGLCLLKRQRPLAAGFTLVYATLLRIFPGFLFVGLLLHLGARMWRERKLTLPPEGRRLAWGGLAALVLLLPLATAAAGDLRCWSGFLANSQKHLDTRLTNNMGLSTALSFEWETRAISVRNPALEDPYADWKEARTRVLEERRPLFVALVVGFGILLLLAVEKRELWVAAVLGLGLVPIAGYLACYYYSFFLVFALLSAQDEWIGIATSALAALSCLFSFVWTWYDDLFTVLSVLFTAFAVGVTGFYALRSEGAVSAQVAVARPGRPAIARRPK